MQYNRPIIKLQLTALDLWLDRMAIAGLIFLWLYTLLNYNILPRIIPIHYDLNGKINGYGEKIIIFLGPLITTVIVGGLSLLNKYPHIFNYPASLTTENAESQYLLATRLLRFIKLAVVCIFIYIYLSIIHDVKSGNSSSGWWTLPLILIIIIAPTAWYFIKALKK